MLLMYDGPRQSLAVGLPNGQVYHHERGTMHDYPEDIAGELLAETRHVFMAVQVSQDSDTTKKSDDQNDDQNDDKA